MQRSALLLAAAMFAHAAQAAALYNFVTVNGPGDNAGGTTINAISNAGALVGFSTNANATVLTNFIRSSVGAFTALNLNNDPLANANGINAQGIVVGTSNGQAFQYNQGLFTILPAALSGETASEVAFGINDNSTIVGQFVDNATDTVPGFVYTNGQFTILNPVANDVMVNAQGVNNNGLVTGFYNTDGQHDHGFFYNTKTGQYTLAPDPVQPNLFLTQFLGINDNGIAVGYWQDILGDQHGFLYNTSTQQYTFLDDPNQGLIPGLSITQITGINDSNAIAGFYVGADGIQRGFLATPVSPTPEPATFASIGIGLACIVRQRLRARRRAV